MMLLLAGCMNLDGFVFNNIPCTEVSAATCEDVDYVWDRVCTTCDEPYAWDADHPWEPGTLADGETIDPIEDTQLTSFTIETEDGLGELDAYLIAGTGDLADTTILYQHGNYAGLEPYIPRVRMLHQAGYTVMAWDYRGYGKSTPHTAPTADQFLADGVQVRGVVDGLAVDPSRIVLYGYSLGALPTVEAALTEPGCAMLLEAPFTSMASIAHSNSDTTLGEQFFSEGRFDDVTKLQGYDGPTLVMVGEHDEAFPPEEEQVLYDGLAGPKQFWEVPGGEHGVGKGVPEQGLDAYLDTLATFLETDAPECLGG